MGISLSHARYEEIKQIIVDMFVKYDVTCVPVNGFELATKMGIKIIPVASWCIESDFEWCFDGLPENSSIAITTNGCMSSPYGKRMLLRGIEELQKRKSPSNLIVRGRHVAELDKYDNVHYYPSFSQRWKERAV